MRRGSTALRSRKARNNVVFVILSLDHENPTYRSAGRDFRLTDVNGKLAMEIRS